MITKTVVVEITGRRSENVACAEPEFSDSALSARMTTDREEANGEISNRKQINIRQQ